MKPPIIVYRLGSLGDTVVALPCFHRIMASFPEDERLVLTNVPVSTNVTPLETILRPGGFIHGTIAYPVGTRDPGELLRVRRELRKVGSHTLIYLGGGRGRARVLRDLLLLKACGFTQIIGAPLSRELEYPRIDAEGFEEPEAERLARCLSELGTIDLQDKASWDLRLTPEELVAGDEFVGRLGGTPFLAVNTGGKVADKDWGEANWSALLGRLGAGGDLGLIILGGMEDAARATRLIEGWRGLALNGCGVLTARESAAVVRHARLFIGHDSGPLHLAAAMDVQCIGIYGDYNRPRRWHPYGPDHIVLHDVRGVMNIGPDAVEAAAVSTGRLP